VTEVAPASTQAGAVEKGASQVPATGATGRHPLVAEAQVWARKAAQLLEREKKPDPAAEIRAEIVRPPKSRPIVVVAGEDKRGKSSLVNALLRKPDISPVGVEVVTATPITLYKSDKREAFVWYYGYPDRYPAPFEDAQTWATVQGNPGNEYNISGIDLGLAQCSLLERITVWDTPGVGGLESGHAALTLQRLKEADALLFVLESGAPIRAEELTFLRNASQRIDTVIFAMTKVDVHRGWKQIMEDNRSILSTQAPRFAQCPMIAVSAKIGLLAARAEAGTSADLWQESGFKELERLIVNMVAGKAGQLRASNLARAGIVPLGNLERQLKELSEALGSPEQAQSELVAEKGRLAELNRERAEWPMTMNIELRRLALDRNQELGRGILELRNRYEERLKDVKPEEHDTLPGEFVADLTAITAHVNEWTVDRIVDLVTKLVGTMDESGMIDSSLQRISDSAFAEELASIDLGDVSLEVTDKISVVQSYSSGHSMASLIAMGGMGLSLVAAPVMLGVGVLLGGFMAFTKFKHSKQSNFVQEFKNWMQDQCQRAQLTVSNTFQHAQIDLEVGIREALKKAFAEREQAINEAIAACQTAMQEAQSERHRRRQELAPKINAVTALRAEGMAILQKSRQTPAGAVADA